ncbi:MAG: hypothetical protein R2828_03930 [Saprospiraceae bacterium]
MMIIFIFFIDNKIVLNGPSLQDGENGGTVATEGASRWDAAALVHL